MFYFKGGHHVECLVAIIVLVAMENISLFGGHVGPGWRHLFCDDINESS